ncbi:MAG: site-specific integrase, partial [Acidobacteria bacterium]|nr:site-specific integrase [Acidobacteriota bacterium]
RGVVTLAFLTGWRITSEVLPLEWGQVDRKAKTIRLEVGSTQNKKGRTLAYDRLPELEQVIEDAWQEHQRLAAEGVLCPNVFHRDGKPIKSFRCAWSSACETAGVPGKIPHDFRRTAARNLIRAGVSQSVAMQVTGHRTPSVFERYNITTNEDVRQGLGRLAEISAGKEKGKIGKSGRVARFPKSP